MWNERKLPDLKQARRGHSSCCMGSTVYVFGGLGADSSALDTIECLLVKTAKDEKITFDTA